MGRFADLCGDVAASLEEGVEGLALPPEAWDRFRASWEEEDIEDAIALVQESLLQGELIDAADSLSARMVDLLATFGGADAFQKVEGGQARLTLDDVGQLARRVGRLEDVLETFRDHPPAPNDAFDALRRRLADYGIEADMASGREEDEE
jgi:uncharacterized protein with von Willebrand factor type A (vWA) domain